jgi:FkbM family methyltransferase
MNRWTSVLLTRLPGRVVRLLGRLQFRSERLQSLVLKSTRHMRSTDVVIARGAAKGLLFNARGTNPGYALGTAEAEVQAILRQCLHPGGVFLDLGANVGFFTVLGARLVGPEGRVYAIEPLAEMAEAVRCNARLNGFSQVEVFEAAVADREGQELLVEGASPLEGHLGAPGRATPHRAVRVTTVDALTRRRGVRAPTVVKMDVEGAEERAVQGMRETLMVAKPIVICELHGRQSRVPALLGDLGYSVNFVEVAARRNPDHWNPHIVAMPGNGSRVT